jgi:peroxiredoxin
MERQWKLHPTLPVGSPAPDFDLPGTDGRRHKLSEFTARTGLAVMFICNHCPASQLYEERIKKMVHDYGPRGVDFVAIQPNAVLAASPRELNYTDVDDSLKSMIIHAKFRHFNFPYLFDGDKQEVAHRFGPKNTPHIFIFDREKKLSYEGRIDDNMREAAVKTQDARDALEALVANRPVAFPQRPVFGCSIKWQSQTEAKQRELKLWQEQPVNLEMASAADLEKLRTNPTGKTLMITFWATWCAPCVEEFDDLIQTYLWYRSRDFELVTVSTDAPEARPAVLKFLQEHHSAVRNLQFASDDVYGLQAAFDSSWDSGVPFTVVLAPDGKIVYKEEGEIRLLPMRRAVLAHLPDMGYIGNAAYWGKP